MTIAVEERTLAVLSPMWQRIARGEVNLEQYTDEEILSGEITMADGRLLPKPKVFPETFIREQERRGLAVARKKVREGALKSFDVVLDILEDDTAEDKDRLRAAEMLQNRFLGKADQRVHVQVDLDTDPRDLLLERLLAARKGIAAGDVIDAEVVEEDLSAEDLL